MVGPTFKSLECIFAVNGKLFFILKKIIRKKEKRKKIRSLDDERVMLIGERQPIIHVFLLTRDLAGQLGFQYQLLLKHVLLSFWQQFARVFLGGRVQVFLLRMNRPILGK